MNKNRVVILALIILLIISGVSIGLNIRNSSEQSRARHNLISQVYSSFRDASLNLDVLIDNIENGMVDDGANRGTIALLSADLVTADTTLKRYVSWFPREGLSYGAFPGFDHVAYTLGYGSGTVNGVGYDGMASYIYIMEFIDPANVIGVEFYGETFLPVPQ